MLRFFDSGDGFGSKSASIETIKLKPVGDTTDGITIPDAHLLFNAAFQRAGDDLVLTGEDGRKTVVPDYFKADKRPTLFSPDGAMLNGDLVDLLAGPANPGQYAQAGAPVQAAAQEVGRVATASGNASAVRNGVAIALNVGDVILKGDVLQTGANSGLGVIFADSTTFTLTANARMVVNDLIYDPAGSNNSAFISLVQGTISFVAGQVAKTGDMRVDTPVASLGIRGTAVQVNINSADGTVRLSVMVEPGNVVGSFNIYSILPNGQQGPQIGTVNNAQIGLVLTPQVNAPPQVDQAAKTPEQIQQEFAIVQQVFQTQNLGQQILNQQPLAPPTPAPNSPDQSPNANPQSNTSSGSSGSTTPEQPTPQINIIVPNPPAPPPPPPPPDNDGDSDNATPPLLPISDGAPPPAPEFLQGQTATTFIETPGQTGSNTPQSDGGSIPGPTPIPGDPAPTVTVSAPLAVWTEADGDLAFIADPGGPDALRLEPPDSTGQVSFTYTVQDGALDFLGEGDVLTVTFQVTITQGQNQSIQTLEITITGTNDAPVISTNGGGPTATVVLLEGETEVTTVQAVDPDLDLTLQGPQVAPAPTYSIAPHSGDDAALFDIDSVTGQLSFLDAPAFDPFGSNQYIVTVAASDGTDSDLQTITVVVSAPNDFDPNEEDDAANVDEGGQVVGNVLANDSDPDNVPPAEPNAGLTVIDFSQGAHGTVTIDANGDFVYTHDGSENFFDTFTYEVFDGAFSSIGTVFVTINPVDDLPIAVIDNATVNEGGQVTTVNVLLNDIDPDSPLTTSSIIAVTQGAHGSVVDNDDGTFTYTHDGSETPFADEFTYTLVGGSVGVVHVSILAVNDAPAINGVDGGMETTNEDTPLLLAADPGQTITDVDASNDALELTLSVGNGTLAQAGVVPGLTIVDGDGADGTLVFSGALAALNQAILTGVIYTPDADFNGADALTITVDDQGHNGAGGPLQATASVSIDVLAVNDAPETLSPPVPFSGDEDASLAAILIGQDIDGAVASFRIKSLPAGGTLFADALLTQALALGDLVPATAVIGPNGTTEYNATVYFNPDPNANGLTSFQYASVDDLGLEDASPGTILLNVTAVNDGPIVTTPGAAVPTLEDEPVVIPAFSVDDVDDASLTVTLTATSTLTLASLAGLSFTQGDGTADATMSFSGAIADINAALAGLIYTPTANAFGAGNIAFAVGDGDLTTVGNIAIAIAAVNDAPVADADGPYSVAENGTLNVNATNGVLAGDADVEGDALTAVLVSGPSNASSFTLNADGSFSYTPQSGFSGVDSFTYQASDGALTSNPVTVNINIGAVNDPPLANDDAATVDEGGQVTTVNVLLNDADPDSPLTAASIIAVTQGAHGSVVDNDDGTFTYTHDGSETTADSFTYTISDGEFSSVATVSVTINPVNDAPEVANAIANQAATEDAPFSFQFAANAFADVDVGNTLAFTATLTSGAALPAWLSFNAATRTFSGTPANDDVGTISVRVTATDASNASVSDDFDITVANVNDAPEVANAIANQAATEDAPFSFQFAANAFADVDVGDTLTFSATLTSGAALPAWLSFNAATRTFSGTPANDDVGTISVRVTATDASNASVSDDFDITVANVNDAPEGANATVVTDEDVPYTFSAADFGFSDPNDTPADAFGRVKITTPPTGGTMTLNSVAVAAGQFVTVADISAGLLQFAPAANANGPAHANFTFQVEDNGGTANGGVNLDPTPNTITIDVNAVNDAPVIAGGNITAAVIEDQSVVQSGQFGAADVEGDPLAWSIVGGVAANADYFFRIDDLNIVKNGSLFIHDAFDDGAPPPSAPNFGNGTQASYFTNGVFFESADRAAMLGTAASAPTPAVGSTGFLVGHSAILASNVDPNNLVLGLKSDDDFTVEARFQLALPDDIGEGYGIRLTDRIGDPTPGIHDNDVLQLLVRRSGQPGNPLEVVLIKVDFQAGTTTFIQQIALSPASGDDQILLRLVHDEANAGVIQASFDLLDNGLVTSSQTFASTGTIFNGENWTRAEIRAVAPVENVSSFTSQFGVLTVDQQGNWQYVLRNGQPAVQQLGEGETVIDHFDVQVADGNGGFDTRSIDVTVTGANDAFTIDGDLQFFVRRNGSVVLTTDDFKGVDPDPAETLVFTVREAFGGHLTLNSVALDIDDTFTQADLLAGLVRFVNDDPQAVGMRFTVDLDDGSAQPPAAIVVNGSLVDLNVTVLTAAGFDFDAEDVIAEAGAGTIQPSPTETGFTIVNAAANRSFVFEGTGFAFDNLLVPTDVTGGTITRFRMLTNDPTPVPLFEATASFDAAAFYDALLAAAAGDEQPFEDLLVDFITAFRGGAGSDRFGTGPNNDSIAFSGGSDFVEGDSGFDLVSYRAAPSAITVDLDLGTVAYAGGVDQLRGVEFVTGSLFADTFDATGFGPTSVNSGDPNDLGSAGGTFNQFEGLAGDDQITGNGATRVSYLHSTAGVTVTLLAGGTGSAVGNASVGTDTFLGGVIQVRGSNYGDTFTGNADSNAFEGRGGDDFIDGGAGFDNARYNFEGAGITVDLAAGMVTGASAGNDTLRSIESIVGTELADVFDATGGDGIGGVNPDFGQAGALNIGSNGTFNAFQGFGGDDIVIGNLNTRVEYSRAAAGVTADLAANVAFGTAPGDLAKVGTDTITNVPQVTGSEFGDILLGGAAANTLSGLGGNDILNGRAGNDGLTGGTGGDIFVYTPDSGFDRIFDFNRSGGIFTQGENDRIDLRAFPAITGLGGLTLTEGVAISGGFTPQVGGPDTRITGIGTGALDLVGVRPTDLVARNFIFAGQIAVSVHTPNGYDFSTIYDDLAGAGAPIDEPANPLGQQQFTLTNAARDLVFRVTTGGGTSGLPQTGTVKAIDIYDLAGNILAHTDGWNVPASDFASAIALFAGSNDPSGLDAIFGPVSYSAVGDAGRDVLIGGDLVDQLVGGEGSDIFIGEGGDDLFVGQGGRDIADYSEASGPISINLAAGTVTGDPSVGTDTLRSIETVRGTDFSDTFTAVGFSGSSTNAGSVGTGNTFMARGGSDSITGNGGTFVSYQGETRFSVNVTLGANSIADPTVGTQKFDAVTGSPVGTDSFFTAAGVAQGVVGVFGTELDDTLTGSTNAAVFESFAGWGGDDLIDGRAGADQAIYSTNTLEEDTTTHGIIVDLASGAVVGNLLPGQIDTVGVDTLRSVEFVRGSRFADIFVADGFNANNPDSFNIGSAGFDINRNFFNSFDGRAGNDIILGNGNTELNYGSATSGVFVDLVAGLASGDDSVGDDIILGGVSRLVGTQFVDDLRGSDNPTFIVEQFEGGAGNDFIDGRDGFDRVVYDVAWAATAGINVNLAAGTVTGDASVGTDTLRSIEFVRGTRFADTFDATGFGATSANAGSVGALNPSGTLNEFEGAAGNDTIIGNGDTRISFIGAGSVGGGAVVNGVTINGVTVTFTAPGTGTATGGTSVGTDTFSGVSRVRGSGINDHFIGSDNPAGTREVFEGRAGDDQVFGNGGFDVSLHQFDGATNGIAVDLAAGTVVARDASDTTVGTDTLRGVEGIVGTRLDDTYDATGFSGSSTNAGSLGTFNNFEGMGGDDTITGNGDTQISYQNAASGVTVDLAAGTAFSTAANDLAQIGVDDITGGVNAVLGSAFDDTIIGDAFDNVLTGGAGNDSLTGDAGSDRFVFDPGFGDDTIEDFTAGSGVDHDVIDVANFLFTDAQAVLAAVTSDVNGDALIDDGFGNTITLKNVAPGSLTLDNFLVH